MYFPFFQPDSTEVRNAHFSGFKDAEDYFRKALREFYRDVKKGRLMRMAITSTATSHKCNCEFCWTNEPKSI